MPHAFSNGQVADANQYLTNGLPGLISIEYETQVQPGLNPVFDSFLGEP